MLNSDLVKAEYDFLGDITHLNCCSVGVPPRRVQAACAGFYEQYMKLVRGTISGYGRFRTGTRERAAQLLNCAPSEIAFSSSTTEGLCALAAGYPLGAGDNVVMCDLENPCAMIPWANAAKNRGFELRIARTNGGCITPDELFALTDENTRIICLSAVQYGTGFFSDVKAIGAKCREAGIVFAVDAIQALGRMTVDVDAMCIDYLSCGGFKGLGAGFGISIIYCSSRIVERVEPAHVGVYGVADSIYAPEVYDEYPATALHGDARRFETGSHNTMGIVLLDAALSLILELKLSEIESHVLSLEQKLRDAIAGTAFSFVGPTGPENRSGIVVLHYPEEFYAQTDAVFQRENIVLTSHPGFIRLAFHCFNTQEHVNTVARALREVSALINARSGEKRGAL